MSDMGYRNTAPVEVRRDQRNRDRTSSRTARRFVGVDGEGGDIRGSHEYLLLRAGTYVLETGDPLTWEQCLGFIADLPTDVIYVSYYFDYDVTMMIRRMPPDRIRRLLNRESRVSTDAKLASLPVDVGQYQIDYLPHKEFKVRRRLVNAEDGKRRYSKWVVISDVGSFFQSSFVSALRKWYGTVADGVWVVNPGEAHMADVIDKIEEGKQQRNSFGQVTEYEREYNLLEIKALELLMTKFRAMCSRVGLHPNRWQGPGNLVMAQFRKVKLPRNKALNLTERFPGLVSFCNAGYYGGRFEACLFGEITGPIYQYDINSAYARTYADLPCLLHSEWRRVDRMPTEGIFVGRISFDHRTKRNIYTLPVRTKKGEILFPRKATGTYWSPELNLAREQGVDIEWHEGWACTQTCACTNFDWVEDLYAERKRLGKDGTGYVLKILLATIYGKLAQSVGTAPYANPIWSGLIVSTVRAQLGAAALADKHGDGRDVVMLATDGLFCTEERDSIDVGDKLGQWELTEHESMFVVQSGVYMLPEKLPKTRGVAQRKVIQHTWDFYIAWERYLNADRIPEITVELRSFLGIKQASHRGRYDLAGQWLYVARTISFDWKTKRIRPRRKGTAVYTSPPEGSKTLESVAYQRMIGGGSFRDMDDEQPDWSDSL